MASSSDRKEIKAEKVVQATVNKSAIQAEQQLQICEICAIFFENYEDIERHFGDVHENDGASLSVSVDENDTEKWNEVKMESIRDARIFFESEENHNEQTEHQRGDGDLLVIVENEVAQSSNRTQTGRNSDDNPVQQENESSDIVDERPLLANKERRRYRRKKRTTSDIFQSEKTNRPIYNVRNKGGRPAKVQRLYVPDPSLFHCSSCLLAFQTEEARDFHVNAMRDTICRPKPLPSTIQLY